MPSDVLERYASELRCARGGLVTHVGADVLVAFAAEVERLRADCGALRADAALGALVRRMPERSGLWRHRDRDGAQQWSEVGLDMDYDMCWATIETSPEVALGEGDDA